MLWGNETLLFFPSPYKLLPSNISSRLGGGEIEDDEIVRETSLSHARGRARTHRSTHTHTHKHANQAQKIQQTPNQNISEKGFSINPSIKS